MLIKIVNNNLKRIVIVFISRQRSRSVTPSIIVDPAGSPMQLRAPRGEEEATQYEQLRFDVSQHYTNHA